jgi:hypothetical protein
MRRAALAALALVVAGCGGDKAGGGEVVTFQRTAQTRPPADRPSVAQATLFTIRVPAGWERKDSTLAGGIQRSEWRDPASPSTSVLVDAVAEATSTPEERARRNRDRGAAKPGYRERQLAAVTLGGREGFVWDYELSGRRIVDYFLNDCGDGYAVQGTAPPDVFDRQAPRFRAAAASLRSAHC